MLNHYQFRVVLRCLEIRYVLNVCLVLVVSTNLDLVVSMSVSLLEGTKPLPTLYEFLHPCARRSVAMQSCRCDVRIALVFVHSRR